MKSDIYAMSESSLDELTNDDFEESPYFMGITTLNDSMWQKLSFAAIIPQSPQHNSTQE